MRQAYMRNFFEENSEKLFVININNKEFTTNTCNLGVVRDIYTYKDDKWRLNDNIEKLFSEKEWEITTVIGTILEALNECTTETKNEEFIPWGNWESTIEAIKAIILYILQKYLVYLIVDKNFPNKGKDMKQNNIEEIVDYADKILSSFKKKSLDTLHSNYHRYIYKKEWAFCFSELPVYISSDQKNKDMIAEIYFPLSKDYCVHVISKIMENTDKKIIIRKLSDNDQDYDIYCRHIRWFFSGFMAGWSEDILKNMKNVTYQKREDRGKDMLNGLCEIYSEIIKKTPSSEGGTTQWSV